jgi:hypothetical protein
VTPEANPWIEETVREFARLVEELSGAYVARRGRLPYLTRDESCRAWGVILVRAVGDTDVVPSNELVARAEVLRAAWEQRTTVPPQDALLSMVLLPGRDVATTIEEYSEGAMRRLGDTCARLQLLYEQLARESAARQVPS